VADAVDPCQWDNRTCQTATCHVGGCQNHCGIPDSTLLVTEPVSNNQIRLSALPLSIPSKLSHAIFHPPKTLA
jgi:hypothetical protein